MSIPEQELYRAIDQNNLSSFQKRCAQVDWNQCLLSVVNALAHRPNRDPMIAELFDHLGPSHKAWRPLMTSILEVATKVNHASLLTRVMRLDAMNDHLRYAAFVDACTHGSLECIKLLHPNTPEDQKMLSHPDNTTIRNNYGLGVKRACGNHHVECASYLLPGFVASALNPPPNAIDIVFYLAPANIWDLAFASMSFALNVEGQRPSFKEMLRVILPYCTPDSSCQSVARGCVMMDDAECLSMVYERGQEMMNPWGCMEVALKGDFMDCAVFLLGLPDIKNDDGYVLARAIQSGHTRMVDLCWDPEQYLDARDIVSGEDAPISTLHHAAALYDKHVLNQQVGLHGLPAKKMLKI